MSERTEAGGGGTASDSTADGTALVVPRDVFVVHIDSASAVLFHAGRKMPVRLPRPIYELFYRCCEGPTAVETLLAAEAEPERATARAAIEVLREHGFLVSLQEALASLAMPPGVADGGPPVGEHDRPGPCAHADVTPSS